ncbi:MFS general substrate transporter [Mycena crocata]|nr:MFS general substrate transporter [Mycena crocata]
MSELNTLAVLAKDAHSATEDVLDAKEEILEKLDESLEDSYPDGGLRAWLIVLGAFFASFSTFGYVFQTYYQLHLLKDSSSSTISWIGSVQLALTFAIAVVMGRLFDNGWFALPAFCASVSLVVLTILIGQCTEFWQFLLCQGFAVGVASGVIFGPTLAIVSHWFKRRRSTAMGIVASGSSAGGLVIPILVQKLLPQIGFPWTVRVVALLLFFTTGILNLTLKRRLPPVRTKGGIFNYKAFKYKPFALYTFGVFVLLTYIDVSATDAGMAPSFAVYLLAIANASSGAGRIMTGLLADRVGCMSVMIPGTLLAAIITYVWPFVDSVGSLIAIAIVYGFASGIFVGLQAVPLIYMGDMSDVGRRTGTLFSILSIGALAGPPISGAIASATGDYKAVGYYAGSVIMVAIVILSYVRYLMTGKMFSGKF